MLKNPRRNGEIAKLVYIAAMVTTVIVLIVGSNNLHARLKDVRNDMLNQTEELNETRRELNEAIARLDAQNARTANQLDRLTPPVDLPGAAKNARP